jgi:hypothetical protein
VINNFFERKNLRTKPFKRRDSKIQHNQSLPKLAADSSQNDEHQNTPGTRSIRKTEEVLPFRNPNFRQEMGSNLEILDNDFTPTNSKNHMSRSEMKASALITKPLEQKRDNLGG